MDNINNRAYKAVKTIIEICNSHEGSEDCHKCPFFYKQEDACYFTFPGFPANWEMNRPPDNYCVFQ